MEKTLLSSSQDATIRLWDSVTGDLLAGPLAKALRAGLDGSVRLWDTTTRDVILPLMTEVDQLDYEITGPFQRSHGLGQRCRILPDGMHAASASSDKSIRIWDVQSGVLVKELAESNEVLSLSISFDGKRLSYRTAGEHGEVFIWNYHTGEHVKTMSGHDPATTVRTVIFSPDGQRIASGSNDNTIRIWDVHNAQAIGGPLEGHSRVVTCVAFSPDSKTIASVSSDATMRLWDIELGNLSLAPIQHNSRIHAVSYSPDGKTICTGSEDGTISLWHAITGNLIIGPLRGHRMDVSSIAFSPDGKRMLSGSYDQTLKVWDSTTGEMIKFSESAGPSSELRRDPVTWSGIGTSQGPSPNAQRYKATDKYGEGGSNKAGSRGAPRKADLARPKPPGACVRCKSLKVPCVFARDSDTYPSLVPRGWLDERSSSSTDTSRELPFRDIPDLTDHLERLHQDPVASGSYGNVYKCKLHHGDGSYTEVAVKAFRLGFAGNAVAQLELSKPLRREIKVWHSLRHPNIARLLGVTFRFGTTISTVSPWISRGPLHAYLAESPELSQSACFHLVEDVAAGLKYLHSFPVVHGDLSSGNVLVDGDGRACLSDFGLCSILGGLYGGSSFVSSTCRPGAIRWAARELVLHPDTVKASTASDVFSFGCIMLQILSGQVPWGQMHETAIVMALADGRNPPRPDNRPICDRDWAFIDRCFRARVLVRRWMKSWISFLRQSYVTLLVRAIDPVLLPFYLWIVLNRGSALPSSGLPETSSNYTGLESKRVT
ncbi:quinon protein alcohol dehydrogenase-like superfamily [Melanogaster broomeanus]|nr:quinon protein alcohol dehydrogenase-like superfamily [Melanogaster broomeanus]